MDLEDITTEELLAAIKKMMDRRARPAQTREEMDHKVRMAREKLVVARQIVFETDQRLRLLERAAILRHPIFDSKQSDEQIKLQLGLSYYCDALARDDFRSKHAEKLRQLIEQCQLKLQIGCKHLLVIGHESDTYGAYQWETAGHMVCAHCGLSEVEDENGYQLLGSAEGRVFIYRSDNEPDDSDE